MQVQTLMLNDTECPTPASSHHLAEALCSMPNLSDLTLDRYNEEFFSTLKAKASSLQGCFPQISKGNFRFNGEAQADLNLFLQTLPCSQSWERIRSGDSDYSDYSGDSDDSDNSGNLNDSDDSDKSNDSDNSADPQWEPRRILPSSDHPQQHVGNTPHTVSRFTQTDM
ncbi:uncharacterized protein LOC115921351 [Strongylocentrotus purpuratus]|uniref:Uncharacterized protein n=1 Tax=Strongylocentrotus purpuratus TaxID=7668 RepID=A0A7M7ND82_STRPU|nr:uncharacterized protein LOC115921351 [Strongylocentrotus purpuratus]